MLTHNDLEKIGEKEVRHSLLCGDYCEPSEISVIESWLRSKDKEHDFEVACVRADKSAAFFNQKTARRAAIAAIIAEIAAVISSICAVFTIINK